MTSGVYHPRWLFVELENGLELRVLTWVVNDTHVRYAGPRPAREMARVMAGCKGKDGTCRDYLANTISIYCLVFKSTQETVGAIKSDTEIEP